MSRIERVRRSRGTALAFIGLLWLWWPAAAVGGYDIAHIVERTCEPGGSLIVTDAYKRPRDRNRLITKPGEVIACPSIGRDGSFQIGAGPEWIGREPYLCTYVSLLAGDGADSCSTTDSRQSPAPMIQPLMTIRVDDSGLVGLTGIASADVAAVAVTPVSNGAPEASMFSIDGDRAARLGAGRAFGYFSLNVDTRTLCAEEPATLVGRDGSGGRIAESAVSISTRLLDSADGVPYARSLKALCGSQAPRERVEAGWLTDIGALLRSILALI